MVSAHDVMRKALWVVQCTVTLVWSMGSGLLWMFNSARFVVYALILQPTFFNHVVHYVSSPCIIRGVAYRSSRATKMKHLKFLLHNDALKSTIECASAFLETQQHGRVRSSLSADPDFLPPSPVRRSAAADGERALNSASASQSSPASSADGSEEDLVDESTCSSEEDPEDAANMHNRSFLDIWLPVPLDALMKTFSPLSANVRVNPAAAGADTSSTDHGSEQQRQSRRRKRFPIVIFVGGGAWIIGYNLWSNAIARRFASRGYLVFTPDYRNFPQATMNDMILDVSDAIAWVIKNAEQYNGDVSNITLIGQSAGAHLAMMSVISQAKLCAEREEDEARAGRSRHRDASSSSSYLVPRYNPRLHVQRFIGLSGIYNLRRLVPHFHKRGLYKHVLYKIMGGRNRMSEFTPPTYFEPRRPHQDDDDYEDETVAQPSDESAGQQPQQQHDHHHHHHGHVHDEQRTPDNFFDFLPKSFSFLHGDADKSAPLSESSHLARVMYEAQVRKLGAQRKKLAEARVGSGRPFSRMQPSTNSSDDLASSLAHQAVEIHYVKIKNASHTDPIVEEAVCSERACLIDFVEYISSSRGSTAGAVPHQLTMSVPEEKMPWVIQLARVINPF